MSELLQQIDIAMHTVQEQLERPEAYEGEHDTFKEQIALYKELKTKLLAL